MFARFKSLTGFPTSVGGAVPFQGTGKGRLSQERGGNFFYFTATAFLFPLVLRLLPGAGDRSPARRGAWGERVGFFILPLFFVYLVLRLLPGAGGRSPARRGAWGERGSPSTPPAPPYSPFCGSVEGVS